MHCPFCNAADSKVIDSRLAAEGCQIRRRRECVSCGERFTTFESYEVVMPRVIKSNGKMNRSMRRSYVVRLCMPYKTSSDTRADRNGSKRYSIADSPFR